MSYIDYFHCAVCDTKAFYDASVDYQESRVGNAMALCKDCEKKYKIIIKNRITDDEVVPKFELKKWI